MKYKTKGTCGKEIDLVIEDGIIKSVEFTGGCHGNSQGISALVRGMNAAEAAGKLRGVKCGSKNTSCPDQLAIAIGQYQEGAV